MAAHFLDLRLKKISERSSYFKLAKSHLRMYLILKESGRRMENAAHLIDGLKKDGITSCTVRAETLNDSSKWKKYYRSKNFAEYGVLVAHSTETRGVDILTAALETEVENYETLRARGFNTPDVYGPIALHDHLECKRGLAIVVQHIDGVGPYKCNTEHRSIKKVVKSKLSNEAQAAAAEAWEQLRDACETLAVQDLQVMISWTGEMFVIDPEQISESAHFKLPTWDEL